MGNKFETNGQKRGQIIKNSIASDNFYTWEPWM